jgi:tetratricopeptide (TPR) repeat protein
MAPAIKKEIGYDTPMIRSRRVVVLAVLASSIVIAGEKLPKPSRAPAEPTDAQKALVAQGVKLHDQQNWAGAIAKYREVLTENPWEVNAIHELSYTYFESKDYANSLKTARLGAECKSPLLPVFYTMMGSALDELGRGKDAIEVYRSAIKAGPPTRLLYYNLAISLRRAGQEPDARKAVEAGMLLEGNHASSHRLLMEIYQRGGYRIPAILAGSRFLALEPESARAAASMKELLPLLTGGVSEGKKPGDFNITVSLNPKSAKDEGDFGPAELMMSIGVMAQMKNAPDHLKAKQGATGFERLVAIYKSLGEAIHIADGKSGFAARYYATYFGALVKAEHTEAFVALAFKAGNIEGAADWMKDNWAKLDAYRAWSQAYQWPDK